MSVKHNLPDDPILIHDPDQEPDPSNPTKRRKIDNGLSVMESHSLNNFNKNSSLKGRKRWNADLSDIRADVKSGLVVHGLKFKTLRPGDDEGAIEISITKANGEHVLSLNLLTSDTSDYPRDHNFFSYCPEGDIPAQFQPVLEDLATAPPRTIGDTLNRLCSTLGRIVGTSTQESQSQSQGGDVDDDSGGEDYEAFDEFEDDFVTGEGKKKDSILRLKLQHDFIETVGTGYRPGYISFGGDDFCLSVSIPVVTLAASIPAQALVAWDRRLLSRTQHLTLLVCGLRGSYPALNPDGTYTVAAQRIGTNLRFKVGLGGSYKPSKDHAQEACRNFGLIIQDAEDELRIQSEKLAAEALNRDWDAEEEFAPPAEEPIIEEEEDDDGRFDKFSLSNSLESLMDQSFLKIVQLRRSFGLGWAGAELLYSMVEKSQNKAEDVYRKEMTNIVAADKAEQQLMRTYTLPHDPLSIGGKHAEINIILTAFCYLIRRLALCTRFCIVCHNKLETDYEALKPYVCDSGLCQYQYYSLNRGPSLEYEIIHNPATVDLLVSMAYSAAAEGSMDDPLPVGMGLRVPVPSSSIAAPPPNMYGTVQAPVEDGPTQVFVGNDGLCDFDVLSKGHMRASIAQMINTLPAIDDIRKHLLRKVKPGKSKPKLREMDPEVLPAAWTILRWAVGSCTAYLEEITSGEDSIKNLDPTWRQFRFSVGAPDAEAKFKTAVTASQRENANARAFPSLWAFHGSPMRNWHSIVRHGLWYKVVANGRAYGNGVYLAKDGSVSMGHYAAGSRVGYWSKSKVCPTNCTALAEIVNLPHKFVSSNPYFVVAETSWIVCRYLLVKGAALESAYENPTTSAAPKSKAKVPFVKLDPAHPLHITNKSIEIPEPGYQIETLLEARKFEVVVEDPDYADREVFEYVEPRQEVIDIEDSDEEMPFDPPPRAAAPPPPPKVVARRPANDWKHNSEWVTTHVAHLLPPLAHASSGATMAVQRELRAMLKEQEECSSYKDLGWYMPPDLIGDNLFQWIVEMHSFDPALPIAKDMAAKKINSIIFELRFPPTFPLAPPFFRIITPRFLPFIQGGGGHVTGGGSICMDLLTSDGWLPSYSIPAVLMQIKLAISNLDPRPARLAQNYQQQYQPGEALEGFRRAASVHGWAVPMGLDQLVR